MIIEDKKEILLNAHGCKGIDFPTMIDTADDMVTHWKTFNVDNSKGPNFKLTSDLSFRYKPDKKSVRSTDISETAFQQLCGKVGIPSNYIKKCCEAGHQDLAIQNFKTWLKDGEAASMKVKEYDGVTRAVLSDRFSDFNISQVLHVVNDYVDLSRFIPNQAFMSSDKLHVRFVDFTPMAVDGEELYPGFTVSSNDVGKGSLNVKFFIYRFACKNGMVITKNGGEMFRQVHMGKLDDSGIVEFKNCFKNIEMLRDNAIPQIIKSKNKILKPDEMQLILEKVKKDCHIGDKGILRIQDLQNNIYGTDTVWGVLNAITETAQDYSLDRRIELETYAGDMLMVA